MQVRLAAPMLVGLAILSLACGGKVGECNKLVTVVNEHTGTLTKAIANLGELDSSPRRAEEFVDTIATAHDDIAGLELADEQVQTFANEYRDLLTEAGRVAQSMGSSAKDHDQKAMDGAVTDGRAVADREEDLIRRINQYCGAEP